MVENRTPRTVPQNSSNIYPIAIKVHSAKVKVADDSYKAAIVIDGKRYDMVKNGRTSFSFDYEPDVPRHRAAYYFDIDYLLGGYWKTYTSRVYELNIINRYAVGFECNRGRPYAQISLLGRGFAEGDRVELSGIPCETEFISPNVLTFTVPLIGGGQCYRAVLGSENGNIGLGDFFVDALRINVEPNSISLRSGERQFVTVSIDVDAPEFGLPLEITTDIPGSIIMHGVAIRSGERSANAVIAGGQPGTGTLFIGAPGFEECGIPVTVYGEGGEDSPMGDISALTDEFNLLD